MPRKTDRNAITEETPTVNSVGGGRVTIDFSRLLKHAPAWVGLVLSVLLTVLSQVSPSLFVDQDAVTTSVDTALDSRIEAAEAKVEAAATRMDRRVDQEVAAIRESMSDKVSAVRGAVDSLKEVVLLRVSACDGVATSARQDLQAILGSMKDLERRVYSLEAAVGGR